ncbi:hypothetical protein CAEBREN_22677 [Caenorhabditis brenneri]|uniref:Uncharacterized protein n=1 Tax=Caenorhabditis brenneri TaxID=135651 RepID=G0NP95_CAEBE|nr:hypothetical protein CAEBREN_22677 [Caenorhabditis brenneri]
MADSLLDNYNPLYDIHLRQYFALPHMQKHLQKMGLLESTLNLNGDEVYARHHAMMDMMLKNREAQLMKMAELRKKLDAAEKVECCRRIRSGQSPESYRQGKPSRSLSRNRAGQKGGSGGRQRRYSNSFEDRDYVQRIEELNADPVEQNTRDPYKRLSANAKRFNYLHKLDDNTLVSYKDNLKKQLQRLERFREISFGPHSVARQPPPPQASWFFRRRSVLNMRGRKATTGNKLNASHDSRTSCPPTTRKRKDSNTRLPPIHPQKNRVPTKPPAPVSLQQITTKLPPAAKKPAPTRGRPSNKRQTTTTTTTTITAVSKSPQISNTNTTTLPALPSVTGHGIFTGAAAAATAAAVGTAAINIDSLINDEQPEEQKEPTPPRSPVLETQKTFDRSSPTQEVPTDILDNLADESEQVSEQAEEEYIPRQIVLDNAPVNVNHGDYEDSDSEPEYAEEDRESPEEEFVRQEVGVTAASPDQPLEVHVHQEQDHISPPVSDLTQESPKELDYNQDVLPSPEIEKVPSPTASARSRTPPTLIFTEQSTEEAPQSPVVSEAQQSPVVDVHSTHVVEHFESHDATPQSPVLSVHGIVEHEEEEAPHSPVMSVHEHQEEAPQSPVLSVHASEHASEPAPQSPVGSVHSSHHSEHHEPAPQSPVVVSEHSEHISEHQAPQSPVGSVHSSHHSEHHEPAPQSPVAASDHHSGPQSPVLSMHTSMHQDAPQSPVAASGPQSPVGSVHSSHHLEHQAPQSPVGSVHSSHPSEHHEPAPQSPILSVHSLEHHFDQAPQSASMPQSPMETSHISEHSEPAPKSPTPSDKDAVELSPSIYSSQFSEQQDAAPQSPVGSERSARSARSATFESSVTMQESYMSEQAAPAPQSPVGSVHSFHHSEHHEPAPQSPVAVSEHSERFSEHQAPRSPVGSVHSSHHSDQHVPEHQAPLSPVGSVHSSHHSEQHVSEHQAPLSPVGSVHSSHHSEHHVPEHQAPLSPVGSVHSFHHSEHQEPAPQSPAAVSEHHEPTQAFERAPSVHSSHGSDHGAEQAQREASPANSPRPKSPAESEKDGFERASSVPSDHEQHHEQAAPQSPVASEKDMDLEKASSVHASAPQSPSGNSPREHHEEHVHFQEGAPEQMEHEATPGSPVDAQAPEAFVPRSPSVHTSDAEEETFEVQHHQVLTHSQPAAPRSPTEMDLYNPSSGPQESPVMSDSEDNVTSAIPIADRIEMEAYHDSPTKESTSPVAVNPIEVQVNAEQVAQQLSTPEQKFEDIINQSADEEASHLIQEALTEAPAIIDMVNTYEEKERFPDAMMTSMYQPGSDHSDHESEPTTQVKEWDEGSQHIKESTINSEFSDGNTHTTYQETVTIVTDNGNAQDHESPKSDNISTDSLIIHDDQPDVHGDQMTQSIYQPHSDDETHEKEWDEGNKHFHETITEHTDDSGKHFTETVTTTTTVIKSGDDDLKNNNDEEDAGSDDEKDKIIEEEDEEHGSNGNLVRETITITTHTVTSGGLPEGGILVDDGDEKNISSL